MSILFALHALHYTYVKLNYSDHVEMKDYNHHVALLQSTDSKQVSPDYT